MAARSRNELLRTETLKRIAVYSCVFFFVAVLQCSFFANLSFINSTPNIILGALAAVSLFESEKTAAVSGVGAGFLADALGGAGFSISPVLMLLFAVILSTVARKVLKSFFPWLLLLLVASVLGAVGTFISILIFGALPEASYLLLKIILPEIISTFIFSVGLYFVFKLAAKLCETKGKFKV